MARRGAAAAFHRVGAQGHPALGCEAEQHGQAVAGVQAALASIRPEAVPVSADVELAADVPNALAHRKGRHGLEPQPQVVDEHRHRRRTTRRPRRRKFGPAQDLHRAGAGLLGVEPAQHQLIGVPAQGHVVGVQPGSLGVDDGEAANGEVAEHVAAQPSTRSRPKRPTGWRSSSRTTTAGRNPSAPPGARSGRRAGSG